MVTHRCLQQIHAFQACAHALRHQQHDHRGAGADHDGVDEYAQRLKEPFLGRMADIRRGRSAWR